MVATARAVVCLSFWLSVVQVRGSYIPPMMNKTIQDLLRHYSISPKERFNGKPVFSKEPLTGKMEGKRVLMGGILDTYEKLIGQMLKQQPTPTPQTAGSHERLTPAAAGSASDGSVRWGLNYILQRVQVLRKNYYQEQKTLLQKLKALDEIKLDNRVVQSKALWELPWLYEEASSLNDTIKLERRMRRRRRRRQARKVKTRLTA
ncbi:interferon gamma-like [Etheostoma cragini]|uniref:interferon gamma-like n=1 Tax=Etheostoma cragini TaxID=417921 RepID=UPI00155F00AD|nr:interferon gamma-like [Etheostoma cragini]